LKKTDELASSIKLEKDLSALQMLQTLEKRLIEQIISDKNALLSLSPPKKEFDEDCINFMLVNNAEKNIPYQASTKNRQLGDCLTSMLVRHTISHQTVRLSS
jgi:hypothetical protein